MRIALSLIFSLIIVRGYGQAAVDYMHNRMTIDRMAAVGVSSNATSIASFPGSPPGLIGDVYLNGDYRNATFILYDNDKLVQGYPAKLDLQRNEFDLLTTTGVRTLAGSFVRSLVWRDSVSKTPQYFVNGKEFRNEDDVPLLGFYQILSDGELNLLKHTELIFKPADTRNITHKVGSGDDKYTKKPHLYYVVGAKAYVLPRKKAITELFKDRKEEMDNFIKINGIDLNLDYHVVAVFDHYNALVTK